MKVRYFIDAREEGGKTKPLGVWAQNADNPVEVEILYMESEQDSEEYWRAQATLNRLTLNSPSEGFLEYWQARAAYPNGVRSDILTAETTKPLSAFVEAKVKTLEQ